MGDEDDKSSSNNNNVSTATPIQHRIRSRFPKAQPNIDRSSGIGRIRRLSGHYNQTNENESPVVSVNTENKIETRQRSRKNSISNENSQKSRKTSISETPPPPPPSDEHENLEKSSSLSINDQLIVVELNQTQQLTTSQSQTQILLTNIEQNYNPKFSKEHIMNIIKHKAMQKLKKIESDSLKEKRRNYKPNIDSENIDRSKLRMRDLLYYNPKLNRTKKQSDTASTTDETITIRNEIETVIETGVITYDDSTTTGPISPAAAISTRTNSVTSFISTVSKQQNKLSLSPERVNLHAPQVKIAEDGSVILNEER